MASSEPARQRSANGLEGLFLKLDVRTYAVLTLPSREGSITAEAVRSAAREIGAALPRLCGVSPAALALAEGGAYVEPYARDMDAAEVDQLAIAEGLVASRNNEPVPHILCRHVLATRNKDCTCLLIDINHAAADGRGLGDYVARLAAHLCHVSPPDAKDAPRLARLPQGLPRDVSPMLPAMGWPSPAYLPLPGEALKTGELQLLAGEGSGPLPPFTLHTTVPDVHAVVAACRKANATLTGLLVASFQVALAERASAHGVPLAGRCVAVSLLVDVRPVLQPAEATDEGPAVAVGTVTLGTPAVQAAGEDSETDSASAACDILKRRLWWLAMEATKDLRQRIARGEATWQAKALAAGKWDEGPPSTAVEVSNVGMLPLPDGCSVRVGQRFDAYRGGISVLVHSERHGQSEAGPLKMAGSPGRDVRADAANAILTRVADLVQLAAAAG